MNPPKGDGYKDSGRVGSYSESQIAYFSLSFRYLRKFLKAIKSPRPVSSIPLLIAET
jgi:hypothetical protein